MPARRPFRVGRSLTGLGLFATDMIKKGAFIVAYRGRRIPDAEARRLETHDARYIFEINSRWSINGASRRNTARYVNHSCRPNAEALIRRGVICYVARRRIKPDEEITVDYGKDYFNAYIKKKGCRCAACNRRADDVRRSKRKTRTRRAKARKRTASK